MYEDIQILDVENKKKINIYLGVKRLVDILLSLIGLIVLAVSVIFIKIIFLLNKDFHSIFFTQKRVGKNGKVFNLYKFRTMVVNAEEILESTLSKSKELKMEWIKNQKLDNDPRITKIGKILRKTSLDELPQFINILKGNMSLIGPRPLVIGELEEHDGNKEIYESVRPGMTGWWACNGRSNLEYEERLKLEYYYVKNISFILDIKCVFKTFAALIGKKGAK